MTALYHFNGCVAQIGVNDRRENGHVQAHVAQDNLCDMWGMALLSHFPAGEISGYGRAGDEFDV